uniref:TNFR-Cys domain-containing protein n=1 Tax=Daphnia galeata TaxID=27404 RepID=A0A8J2REJ9_9CRUS|nr:unnamed protein product [Daphnia galeata]
MPMKISTNRLRSSSSAISNVIHSRKTTIDKIINLPAGTLALLAAIGFLSLNYSSLSVEGYEHHRWRHRSSISHLAAHHLTMAPIGQSDTGTTTVATTTTTTATTTIENRIQGEDEQDEQEDEDSEEEEEEEDSSSSLGFVGLCSRCPPGFGVARRCTLVQDTVCHSCPSTYYSPSYSKKHACWPCSKCGEGLYEVQPCTGTSDTVCQACLRSSARHFAGTGKSLVANGKDRRHLCGHHHHHRGNSINHQGNNGDGPSSSSSQQQRNLLSTLTIGDTNKNKRTTSGNLIHFLNHPVVAGRPAAANSSTEPPTTLGSSSSEINAETSSAEEDEVALGVAQLAAFQVVLIFTAVAAILALTCRLRVFSSHEPARLKLTETYRDDGVALIEQLSES